MKQAVAGLSQQQAVDLQQMPMNRQSTTCNSGDV